MERIFFLLILVVKVVDIFSLIVRIGVSLFDWRRSTAERVGVRQVFNSFQPDRTLFYRFSLFLN